MHFDVSFLGAPIVNVDQGTPSLLWDGVRVETITRKRITAPRVPVGTEWDSWPEKAYRVKQELERAVVALDAASRAEDVDVNQTVFCIWDTTPITVAVLSYLTSEPKGVETLEIPEIEPNSFAELMTGLFPKVRPPSMGCALSGCFPYPLCGE